MSQYRLETEEDMSAYLDINFGHGVTATYTVGGSSSTINIIINNEYFYIHYASYKTYSSNYSYDADKKGRRFIQNKHIM